QKSVYGATQKEVLKQLQQIQADMERGVFLEPSKMTVAQWLDVWTAEYLGGVKPNTKYDYERVLENYITPALGAVKLQKLNPHNVQQCYNDMQRIKGLSSKTIKNTHGVFHSALKQAQRLGYIQRNPADNIALPRIERPEVQPMSDDVLPAFLEAIQGHEFEAVYFVTVFTGMRKGEVLGLTWNNVDFERGTVCIRQQLLKKRGENAFMLASPKNDKPRTISPSPSVMAVLRGERVRQKRNQLQAGTAWSNPDNLVFTNPLGRHLIPNTVYCKFKRIAADLGVADLRYHDLRHTYAVNALHGGDDVKTVQGNLGHHTAAFTLDTYGHVTEQMQRDSAARMERIIEDAKKRSKSG
ncbi:MAG: site-specific integrase, partial [Oscillospiraceae bacterium]|nr:site-specific integrase [Oscillospiraceae bacterium]